MTTMIEMVALPSTAAQAMMVHTLEPMDPVSAAVEGGATTLHKQMRKLLSLLIAPSPGCEIPPEVRRTGIIQYRSLNLPDLPPKGRVMSPNVSDSLSFFQGIW